MIHQDEIEFQLKRGAHDRNDWNDLWKSARIDMDKAEVRRSAFITAAEKVKGEEFPDELFTGIETTYEKFFSEVPFLAELLKADADYKANLRHWETLDVIGDRYGHKASFATENKI